MTPLQQTALKTLWHKVEIPENEQFILLPKVLSIVLVLFHEPCHTCFARCLSHMSNTVSDSALLGYLVFYASFNIMSVIQGDSWVGYASFNIMSVI